MDGGVKLNIYGKTVPIALKELGMRTSNWPQELTNE